MLEKSEGAAYGEQDTQTKQATFYFQFIVLKNYEENNDYVHIIHLHFSIYYVGQLKVVWKHSQI